LFNSAIDNYFFTNRQIIQACLYKPEILKLLYPYRTKSVNTNNVLLLNNDNIQNVVTEEEVYFIFK
jgi:hypothetical protein